MPDATTSASKRDARKDKWILQHFGVDMPAATAGASALAGTVPAGPGSATPATPARLDPVKMLPGAGPGFTRSNPVTVPTGQVPADPRQPDRLVGVNYGIATPIPKDSPVLPGGAVTTTVRNADPATRTPLDAAQPPARVDLKVSAAKRKDGTAPLAGSLRLDRSGPATATVQATDDAGLSIGAGATIVPGNASKTAITANVSKGQAGLRATLVNPAHAKTPAGKSAASSLRMEAAVSLDGKPLPTATTEAYVFGASTGTPGSRAGSQSFGAGVRFNAINTGGNTPVTGSASVELSESTTTAGGKGKHSIATSAAAVKASLDLVIGKPDDAVTGFASATATMPLDGGPVTGAIFGGIRIQTK